MAHDDERSRTISLRNGERMSDRTRLNRRTVLATISGSTLLLAGCTEFEATDPREFVNDGDDDGFEESDVEADDEPADLFDDEEESEDGEGGSNGDEDSDDNDDESEEHVEEEEDFTIEFESHDRIVIEGEFDEDDAVYASTSFLLGGRIGNTMIEDGFDFGDEVDAPFEGRVIVEITDEDDQIDERGDEIRLYVSPYGDAGTTTISSLSLEPGETSTHGNPHSTEHLEQFGYNNPDVSGPDFEVTAIDTNSPVGTGEIVEIDATIENTGDVEAMVDVTLVVGHDPTTEDEQRVELEPGESTNITLGFRAGDPTAGEEEFPVEVSTSYGSAEEMIVVSE